MENQKHLLQSFLSFLLLILWLWGEPLMAKEEAIPVGVLVDLNSSVGRTAQSFMSIALSDFYAVNADYKTRLSLFTRDSGDDIIGATSAALDLMKNEEVHAIIGPQWSSQAKFVIELGRKAQVPIISFSATSPYLSPTQNPFFIRTAQNDSTQVKAIADILQAYGWHEIVLIYEDTDYGNGLVPYLTEAFEKVDTRVPCKIAIPPSSKETEIMEELNNLKATQRIFLVHMTASLGSKLFVVANDAGMMREGYAWIVTGGLSALFDPMSPKIVMDSMQGVLGIRPYLHMSKALEDFKRRWKMNSTTSKPNREITELNLFGLWAYDTVWALAMAVEKAGIVHSSFLKQNVTKSNVDLASIGIFEMGPRLRDTILTTKFQGLSGNFHLVKGQLEPSAFEIFNVIGTTERIIGYWTTKKGLSRELNNTSDKALLNPKDMLMLKQPLWPGETTHLPNKLRIGVPVRHGFSEFLKIEWHQNKPKISGFSNDVFVAVLEALPFPLTYEFIPFMNKERQSNGSYDELLYQLYLQKYDAVVGDTTIVANRSLYVDFTLPYSESGVSMLVLMKDNERNNIWIFLKPLSVNLWLTTGVAFVFTGLVIWVLEHRINTDFRGPPEQQLGMIFWFSFSTLVFAHREKVVNNWSRFVLIVWVFVVLILTQSYTASLASMLTVQRLQPTFVDVKEIKKNGYFVGYQTDSFVKGLLIEKLKFDESKLISHSTPEEYHEALSNGSIAAIFDEIPYIKLFLAKYCSRYTMVGPTYKTDGFGFAFPKGSPLVPYISRAILNVTEDNEKMGGIERNYFGSQTTCEDQSATISSNSPSLGVYSFGGLFIITGVASMSALLVYVLKFLYSHWHSLSTIHSEGPFWLKFVEMAKYFDQKDLSLHHLKRNDSKEHVVGGPDVIEASLSSIDDMQNHCDSDGSHSSRHGDAS